MNSLLALCVSLSANPLNKDVECGAGLVSVEGDSVKVTLDEGKKQECPKAEIQPKVSCMACVHCPTSTCELQVFLVSLL